MPDILLEPELEQSVALSGRWMVTIFNDDTTPYGTVIVTLMKATGCDIEEAKMETWEAHHFGKAAVHFAAKQECDEAAVTIRSIGVKTEVSLEWQD